MRIRQSGQGRVAITATVVAVAVAAVLTTLVTVYGEPAAAPGTQLSGRPPAPMDLPVVRAPPVDRPPASVLGGPPEPAAR